MAHITPTHIQFEKKKNVKNKSDIFRIAQENSPGDLPIKHNILYTHKHYGLETWGRMCNITVINGLMVINSIPGKVRSIFSIILIYI